MAELNDKLITYGNLSTFYDKLQEQGLGGNAIEDVSVLPDAGENKSKLVRLESDDNVYLSELKSRTSTTTNRLPDAQQIDKAYLYDVDEVSAYYYKGTIEIICSDGSLTMYKWNISDTEFWATLKNAVDIVNTDDFWDINENDGWTLSATTATNLNITINEFINEWGEIINSYPAQAILATYNAPEVNQIGNAYIDYGYFEGIYRGEFEIRCSNGNQTFYRWADGSGEVNWTYLTKIPASEILSDNGAYCIVPILPGDDGDFTPSYNHGIPIYWEFNGTTAELDTYFDNNSVLIQSLVDDGASFYIPQLNAPDSEQVGHASIDDDYYGGTNVYTGEETTIEVDGNNITVYIWQHSGSDVTLYSTKPAYQIYNVYRDSDDVHFYIDDGGITELTFDNGDLIEISTVKYQRTDVVEEWDWLPLTDNATNDDIDAMFTSESPVVKRVLMKRGRLDGETQEPKYPLSLGEGLVNENDETMEWDGQTYYKWTLYENDEIDYSVDGEHPMIYLTTSLNPTLPFDRYSSECAYVITDGEDDYNGYTKVYPKIALIHEDGSITYEE